MNEQTTGPTDDHTDSAVLNAVTKMLEVRSEHLKHTLKRDFGPQLRGDKHLDEGTPERAYWHAGYLTAMRDVLRMIRRRELEWPPEVPGVGRADL
jgi:hypothetical protein